MSQTDNRQDVAVPVGAPAPPDAAVVEQGYSVGADVNRRIKELGASALFAVMSVAVAFPPSHEYGLVWLTLPIMVLACLHFGRRATDPSPRLVIDDAGITERTSIFGGTLHVPWEDVLSVSPARFQNAVELEIRDITQLRARVGFGRHFEIIFNRVFGKKTVSLDLTLLGVRKGEVSAQIETALLAAERRHLGFGPELRTLPDSKQQA